MRFAIDTPNFGAFSDPRLMSELAHEAEDSGWDGFFLWDHAIWGRPEKLPVADTWTMLALMAAATNSVKLGSLVTPIPLRRPWRLAREASTLDRFSGGRIIVGVGIGGDWFGDYSTFDEPTDDRTHGEMLDEGLDILAGLWSGEDFSYSGKHYQIRNAQFLPTPMQQPRIPIWIAGRWPNKKPFRRAAEWDGIYPLALNDRTPLTPDDYREILAYIKEYRTSDAPYDVVYGERTDGNDPAADGSIAAPYAEAGVTWWMEGFGPVDTIDMVRERIHKGPPRM